MHHAIDRLRDKSFVYDLVFESTPWAKQFGSDLVSFRGHSFSLEFLDGRLYCPHKLICCRGSEPVEVSL